MGIYYGYVVEYGVKCADGSYHVIIPSVNFRERMHDTKWTPDIICEGERTSVAFTLTSDEESLIQETLLDLHVIEHGFYVKLDFDTTYE